MAYREVLTLTEVTASTGTIDVPQTGDNYLMPRLVAIGATDVILSRYAAKQLMISGDGGGATTNSGWILGYFGSTGESSIHWSGVAPSATNYSLWSQGASTNVNAPSDTVRLTVAGVSKLSATATLNTSVNPLSITDATDSSSLTTGSSKTAGGFAAAKSAYIGGNVNIVSANGATWTHGQASELLTLSTSGTTTDTTANLLPANSIIESVVARVTTEITTATDWKLGDPTTAGRFTAANATLAAGTTDVGLVHIDQTGAAGPRQTAAAKVRVTTTGTPGAGVVRITVFYRTLVSPTS